MSTTDVLRDCYIFIDEKNLEVFKLFCTSLFSSEIFQKLPWDYMFHRVYLHACLKGAEPIASWLQTTMYPMLPAIEQIALRQIFPYGRHLMATAKRLEEVRRAESV
jgi:hypothetical protein